MLGACIEDLERSEGFEPRLLFRVLIGAMVLDGPWNGRRSRGLSPDAQVRIPGSKERSRQEGAIAAGRRGRKHLHGSGAGARARSDCYARAMMKRVVVAVALLVLACGGATTSDLPSSSSTPPPAAPPPGDQGCTTIGCSDGFHLRIAAPNGWKPGAYVFTVVSDGAEQVCEGGLPLQPCGTPSIVCKGQGAAPQITESGCALPANAHGFGDIVLPAGPAKISLKITRGGAVLVEQELAPTYVTTRPNGPSCEPICRQASAAVTLP